MARPGNVASKRFWRTLCLLAALLVMMAVGAGAVTGIVVSMLKHQQIEKSYDKRSTTNR